MKGRKPLTDRVKVMRGQTRPSQLRGDGTLGELPMPGQSQPYRMPVVVRRDRRAAAMWRALEPVLRRSGVLDVPGLTGLANLCLLQSTIDRMWAEGQTPTIAMLRESRALQDSLGLTPSSRSRVGRRADTDAENPFVALRAHAEGSD